MIQHMDKSLKCVLFTEKAYKQAEHGVRYDTLDSFINVIYTLYLPVDTETVNMTSFE